MATSPSTLPSPEKVLWLSNSSLERFLVENSRSVQLAALSLLVFSPQATKPLTQGALNIVKNHLGHLFTDTDANFRSEVQSLVHLLIDRIKSVTFNLQKTQERESRRAPPQGNNGNSTESDNGSGISTVYRAHEQFMTWLVLFLALELVPTASYQRHISALKTLDTLLRSGIDPSVEHKHLAKQSRGQVFWPFTVHVFTPLVSRVLLDLLLDPFDDVRQAALATLKLNSTGIIEHESQPDSKQIGTGFEDRPAGSAVTRVSGDQSYLVLDRARRIMYSTGRVDHADGVARIYDLIDFSTSSTASSASSAVKHSLNDYSIVEQLVTLITEALRAAKVDLADAVESYPVHGLLTALR